VRLIKTNLPSLLRDNDAAYLEYVEKIIRSIDEIAEIAVFRTLQGIAWHIKPSHPDLKQPTLKSLLKGHTAIGIIVTLSSTINTSRYINFSIPIGN
jgi:hypothetical protein